MIWWVSSLIWSDVLLLQLWPTDCAYAIEAQSGAYCYSMISIPSSYFFSLKILLFHPILLFFSLQILLFRPILLFFPRQILQIHPIILFFSSSNIAIPSHPPYFSLSKYYHSIPSYYFSLSKYYHTIPSSYVFHIRWLGLTWEGKSWPPMSGLNRWLLILSPSPSSLSFLAVQNSSIGDLVPCLVCYH